jgi:3-deoxy-D-manno-octulosonate 8-phosphate phosphatase (KDO 8-P phosphatase)
VTGTAAVKISAEVLERMKRVRLLLFDVDGVLTDGGLYYGNSGEEMKRFHVRDGAGIWIAQKCGLEVGLLTGKTSVLVERRAADLGLKLVRQGALDKVPALQEMVRDGAYPLSEIAYMGDDVLDLPVIRRVGLAACPADAHELVRSRVHYVCAARGGRGAVRELIDGILRAQGKMDGIVARFWEEEAHA